MINPDDIYIQRYGAEDSNPHHSLIQEMRNRDAVDSIYAAVHADLPPVVVAYVYDESDEDGACCGFRLFPPASVPWMREGIHGEDWWYEDAASATNAAKRAVEATVEEMREEMRAAG